MTIEDDGVLRWFLKTDDGRIVAIRDVLTSVAIVAFVGLVLFGLSGAWPPLVAVESGSMEPNMQRGDLIFVVDDDRYVGDDPIDGTGIVTYDNGAGGSHEKFGKPGDVVIFKPDGSEFQTPVIHRVHFWVEEGENWVETKANPDYVGGASCGQLATCPANHDGFITKGDANSGYDQAVGGARTDVVKPAWVTGKGMLRVPWLGHVRLAVDELLLSSPTPLTSTSLPLTTSGSSALPGWSLGDGAQLGLVTVASAVAFAGSRRPGSW
ncbi:S26 family signal peptidase [Natronobeatus ordinarius]|uniref:S26 family signal peptidase n=1 Tax=Natronobeatus ordinarius TaxID=2963433 RepID=UPI003CE533F6